MKYDLLRAALLSACVATSAVACSDGEGGEKAGNPSFQREEAPAHEGVHSFAHGCYAVEGFDGANKPQQLALNTAGDGYTFTDKPLGTSSRWHMRAADLGTYLFFDTDKRFLVAQPISATADLKTATSWTLTRPDKLESEVDRLDEGFISPAEWQLEVSTRDKDRFQLRHRASGRYLTLTGLTDTESGAAIITLHPQQGCAAFPELSIDAEGSVKPKKWDDGDLYGVAEVHSHMMADLGFGGGGLFHGASFHRLGVERALPDCSRSHGPEGRRDLMGFFYDGDSNFDLAALLPVAVSGQFAEFNHHTDGYPTFTDWPNSWRKSTHQTMYYRWLERAWLSGLRLLVQHATGNSVMCDLTVATKAQKSLFSCNDMASVDRAIERAHALERYIDAQSGGPGKGWLKVVGSPAEAREVIGGGKLALVLGIEISNLFDCFLSPPKGFKKCTADTVREKLDHYRSKGVRVIFPVHKYDNGFSPGDGSGGMIELGNMINSGHYSNFVQDCPGISSAFDKGGVTFGGLNKPRDLYDADPPLDFSGMVDNLVGSLAPHVGDLGKPPLDGTYCQKHGLTPLGKTLMNEMMLRGMMLDVAHLPQRALVQAYAALEKNDYPVLKTHGDSNGGKVYKLGGLLGTRLGRCADPKKPGNMGKSLTNAVAEAVANGAYASEALSFDLNGFAGGPRPRFGKDKGCGAPQANPMSYPFKSFDGQVTFTQPHLGSREVDFNTEGMIHIGLLPEVIEDARRDGVTDKDLEPLFRSAEAFVRLWEKAETRSASMRK